MTSPIRQTSLGMQQVGRGGPLGDYPRGEMRTKDNRAHMWGIGLTLFLHVGIAATVIAMNELDRSHAIVAEKPFESIEAGLAIKSKSASQKKSALPQKELVEKVKPPEGPKVTKNADVVPPKEEKPKEKKNETPPPPDATDPKSVFDKYRRVDTGATQGAEKQDSNQTGDANGSEFGTLERAKGDPYVGELIGRMITDFVVPTVVNDQNLVTYGCVKLDENGKIVDRAIDPDHKSKSHAFNSSVEDRLKDTTDMDKPVPSHLKKMLVGKFVCATYTSRTE